MSDVTMTMRNLIANAVYSGQSVEYIAGIADDKLRDQAENYTPTNLHLLQYHVANALKHPKNYTDVAKNRTFIDAEINALATKIDREPLGPAITSEFWMWECFIDYEFIAQVCKIVADTKLVGGKKR